MKSYTQYIFTWNKQITKVPSVAGFVCVCSSKTLYYKHCKHTMACLQGRGNPKLEQWHWPQTGFCIAHLITPQNYQQGTIAIFIHIPCRALQDASNLQEIGFPHTTLSLLCDEILSSGLFASAALMTRSYLSSARGTRYLMAWTHSRCPQMT